MSLAAGSPECAALSIAYGELYRALFLEPSDPFTVHSAPI